MPRDEIDVRNIVASKCVPRIALRLRDPLNADLSIAARPSTTTEQSPLTDTVDKGQTTMDDPLPAQAGSLKRAHTNEIGGDHGDSGKHCSFLAMLLPLRPELSLTPFVSHKTGAFNCIYTWCQPRHHSTIFSSH